MKVFKIFLSAAALLLAYSSHAQQDSVWIAADTTLRASVVKQWFLGEMYRDVWATPVKLPVLDITTVYGGLTPMEPGGGQQTRTVRMEDKNGNWYALRSVQKFPDEALPEEIRVGIMKKLAKDQISSSMPYGAVIIASLAERVGVYHTNPAYYYVPFEDHHLGEFAPDFVGTMVMLEERPEDYKTPHPTIGLTSKWEETDDFLEERLESTRHVPDQEQFLRTRFLDWIVGDWDRHEGQWDWGVYDYQDSTVYAPVPVDRDNSFYHFDGLLPWIVSRDWAVPKFQLYQPSIPNLTGFNYNARNVDRFFLNELQWEDWEQIAREVQAGLTDEAIEEALRLLPPPVYDQIGEWLKLRLQGRRDELLKNALEYYHFLAREIYVVGSEEVEHFIITRTDTATHVEARGEGGITFYSRFIWPKETKRVVLYGLEGDDTFTITGAGSDVEIIVLGGEGADTVNDNSSVPGWRKHTIVYDYANSVEVSAGSETIVLASNDTSLHEFEWEFYKYNYLGPVVELGYNPADGLQFGTGILYRKFDFFKEWVEQEHKLLVSYLTGRTALEVEFDNTWNRVIRRRGNIFADVFYQGPNFRYIKRPEGDVLYDRLRVAGGAEYPILGPLWGKAFAAYDGIWVDGSDEQIQTAGGGVGISVEELDYSTLPERGFKANGSLSYWHNLRNDYTSIPNFIRQNISISGYFTIKPVTLAARSGVHSVSNDLYLLEPFFGENTLIRGFERKVFAEQIWYNNFEARLMAGGGFGVYGYYDFAITTPFEEMNKTYSSYGGGIILAPARKLALSLSYEVSEEFSFFAFQTGLFF